MNFLAHLVLGPQTPDGYTGAIAPDLIRGPLPRNLPQPIRLAALEHQRIDRFTDSHPVFHRTRQRLRKLVHPRLAGVVTDVVYDHVLAREWAIWRADSRDSFIAQAEDGLRRGSRALPETSRVVIDRMIEQRWLGSYATAQGLRDRLEQMSLRVEQRLGRPIAMVPSANDLERIYPLLVDDFKVFWPALCQDVVEWRCAA